MTATVLETGLPGYVTGTWTIDPVHSEVGFSVRHMMVSKVRGKFTKFAGEIRTAADPLDSTATGQINRNDFGVNWNAAIEAGGVVVADKVTLHLEIEAVLNQ